MFSVSVFNVHIRLKLVNIVSNLFQFPSSPPEGLRPSSLAASAAPRPASPPSALLLRPQAPRLEGRTPQVPRFGSTGGSRTLEHPASRFRLRSSVPGILDVPASSLYCS